MTMYESLSAITYDVNTGSFRVLCDGEAIGYAASYYDGDELQRQYREDVLAMEIGSELVSEAYRARYPAHQPFMVGRVPLHYCLGCGPVDLTLDADGLCGPCADLRAARAEEAARNAALERAIDAALAQTDPVAVLHQRWQERLRNICGRGRAETIRQRDRRERSEAGW